MISCQPTDQPDLQVREEVLAHLVEVLQRYRREERLARTSRALVPAVLHAGLVRPQSH